MDKKENSWFIDLFKDTMPIQPNLDLEDEVINQIVKETNTLNQIKRNRKMSWLMLGLGTIIGLLLPYFITWFNITIPGIPQEEFKLFINGILSIGILSILGVLLLEKLQREPEIENGLME